MEEKTKSLKNHFTDSIFYEIELTAKYCRKLGGQVLELCNANVSLDEYAVLDTIVCNSEICQRDIAKLILRDRANTGKILDSLEQKGYIQRILTTRSNRPIKMVSLTNDGLKEIKKITKKIHVQMNLIKEKVKNSDLEKTSVLLKELRSVLDETLKIQI